MKKRILLVGGWRGSGKTHLCRHVATLCEDVLHVEFADELKRQVAQKYQLSPAQMADKNGLLWHAAYADRFEKAQLHLMIEEFRANPAQPSLPPSSPVEFFKEGFVADVDGRLYTRVDRLPVYWTVRSLLIFEGSITRAVRRDYWATITCDRIREYFAANGSLAVVGGFRFLSEETAVRNYFAQDDNVLVFTLRIDRFDEHPENSIDPSERQLDSVPHDFVLRNRSTVNDYEAEIGQCILKINARSV